MKHPNATEDKNFGWSAFALAFDGRRLVISRNVVTTSTSLHSIALRFQEKIFGVIESRMPDREQLEHQLRKAYRWLV